MKMIQETHLWCCQRCYSTHGLLHSLCLYIKMLELSLKLIHDISHLYKTSVLRLKSCMYKTYLFQVHGFQGSIH